jgi:phosphatidylserine/phosphatidylglycerophosphate/cardiolipin synthase-like enzyme
VKSKLVICAALMPAVVLGVAGNEFPEGVYFGPEDDCEGVVMRAIAATSETIDIEMGSLYNKQLTDALVFATQYGVRVRVILDREGLLEGIVSGPYLADGGAEVRICERPFRLDMASAVFDGRVAAFGTYDWSLVDDERTVVLEVDHDPATVDAFQRHFDALWGETSPLGKKPEGPYDGPYVATPHAPWFHRADCPFAEAIPAEYCVEFATRDEALDEKLRCAYCRP